MNNLLTYSSFINAQLCRKVGLERLYEYQVVFNLVTDNGRPCSGLASARPLIFGTKIHIFLKDKLPESKVQVIYLHEVGHVIAYAYDLDDAPDAISHNKYFGVLVAVMYRRADLLQYLQIYDFSDTHSRTNGQDGPLPIDEELIHRFEFILTKSALYARTSLTIEQIAQHLAENDLTQEYKKFKNGVLPRQKSFNWDTFCKGVALGMAITMLGAGALIGAWLIHFI